MKKHQSIPTTRRDQRGAVAIIVAVFLLFVGIGFAAFAIDFGFRHVAKNELQNAADAGALAGARALYFEDFSRVNDGTQPDPTGTWNESANQIAYDAAIANLAANKEVEIYNYLDNTGVPWTGDPDSDEDIQRGHWSFGREGASLAKGFYPVEADVVDPVNLTGASPAEIDDNMDFVNAVRVVTRRQASPVGTFFARIFGQESFPPVIAKAVAWRGFSAGIDEGVVDTIIAICKQAVWDDDGNGVVDPGELECNYGRMLNSGVKINDKNTGGWTNFSIPCVTANPANMRPLLEGCKDANEEPIPLETKIGTTGGVDDSIFDHPSLANLMNCWKQGSYVGPEFDNVPQSGVDEDGMPLYPWTVTLPMIDCPGNNVSNCSTVVGAITVNIVWMVMKENDIDADAPRRVFNPTRVDGDPETPEDGFWEDTNPSGVKRWNSFVDDFQLRTVDGELAYEEDPDDGRIPNPTLGKDGFKKKSAYFMPGCTTALTTSGDSGGPPLGVPAKRPKLVQ